jgi:ABC-type lipoprotein release transport system permease subunit
VILWDLNTLEKPKFGEGIYFTDENGECNISGEFLKLDHIYRIYAGKGSLESKSIEYIPAVNQFKLSLEGQNVSFSLIPGAAIVLEGTTYLVESSSPGENRIIINFLNETNLNGSFINEFGDSDDAWFLGLGRNIVIVPANIPIILKTTVRFTNERFRLINEVFSIYDSSSPFLLPQGSIKTCQISIYSLRRSLEIIDKKISDVSSQLNKAQATGFVVFEERSLLADIQRERNNAETVLGHAQNDNDFYSSWIILREAYGTIYLLSLTLDNMYLISVTSTIYLPAIIAIFSVVLAFFFFDKEKKKIISSIITYIAFLSILYFLYPGMQLITNQNVSYFLESVIISFIGISAFVFGVPHFLKERVVEGEVSARSAIIIIFSMGKRQIRHMKIRNFFTILSIIILVLAFTSLTSIGTVYGIISQKYSTTAPSNVIMVKRLLNETSPLFSPLKVDDQVALSKITKMNNVALRFENIPSSYPTIQLLNPNNGRTWSIYGLLGITPINETIYTSLNSIIDTGSYLGESRDDEILIGRATADDLNITINENVTLEILGTGVLCNFIVKGIVNNERYANLVDIDGQSYGPLRLSDGSLRTCNSAEVVIVNWKSIDRLQRLVEVQHPEGAQVAVLANIVFRPEESANIDSLVRILVIALNYNVFVSFNGIVTYYHIASYVEVKGIADLLIPLIMVILNVGMVMMNAVYERGKEIRTLSMMGLNPTHIGLIFVAEAIILGMVGGSIGYLAGLGFYRLITLLGQELMVREKLEWWWSIVGFTIALLASVLSAIRPAALAISTYTPSKLRKVKVSKEKTRERKEEVFKVYQSREVSMPVKIKLNEKDFFLGFFLDRLNILKSGHKEKVENIEDIPEEESTKGELTKIIKFDYCFETIGQKRKTRNSLILTKSQKEDYYRVKLSSEPAIPGTPESAIERSVDIVNDIVLYWAKNKDRMINS